MVLGCAVGPRIGVIVQTKFVSWRILPQWKLNDVQYLQQFVGYCGGCK